MTEPDTLRGISVNISDMRDRIARMEVALSVVPRLEADVRELRDAETRRKGAVGAFGWLAANGPGMVFMTIIFILGLMVQKGIIAK